MKMAMIWAFLATVFFSAQAQAQGYEGLFAPQSDYDANTTRSAAAPQQESYGGYDGVLAPVEGPAPAETGGYYGGTEGDGFSMPDMGLDAGGVPADDFYSVVVTGAPKSANQIRELKRQSLEEAKKKRLEETRRINAEARQQRDLVRQEKARKQAEQDRLRLEQAQKQAQAQAQR